MGFEDFSNRFKQAQSVPDKEDDDLDIGAFYSLRARMLGVLVRDARLSASRTVEDSARIIGVPTETYQAWEYGTGEVPSLPQLELLAFYFGVPISHFWGDNTLQEEYGDERRSEAEYIKLRQRMVGALLQQAREEAELSIEAIAEDAGIPAEQIQRYENGEIPIPMHELQTLARSVKKTMSYFLESSGKIGELLATREEWKHFSELPDDIRAFAANPLNVGFIEIAIMLSQMPTDKLRRVGSSIVDITM